MMITASQAGRPAALLRSCLCTRSILERNSSHGIRRLNSRRGSRPSSCAWRPCTSKNPGCFMRSSNNPHEQPNSMRLQPQCQVFLEAPFSPTPEARRDKSRPTREGALRLPLPSLDLRHVVAVLADVLAMLDELVAQMLLQMRGTVREARHEVDDR